MREWERLKVLKAKSAKEAAQRKSNEKAIARLTPVAEGGSYSTRLQQAGIPVSASTWVFFIVGFSLVLAIVLAKNIGALVGLILGPACCFYYLSIYITAKAEKRRKLGVDQLPGFVDTLSASLGTGYTMDVAFEHATNSLPNSVLKQEFTSVVELVNKGVALDEALEYLVKRFSGQEIVSLVITIRMFSDMGGRALTPFKRLGYKMREQQSVLERASRDLVGTKQAFYVIFFLSFTAPLFLLVAEPEYLKAAFNHSWIKYVMQLALVAQAMCFVIFKRFTTLKV